MLMNEYAREVAALLAFQSEEKVYGFEVQPSILFDACPKAAELLQYRSGVLETMLFEALCAVQGEFIRQDGPGVHHPAFEHFTFKHDVRVRLAPLPAVPEFTRANVSSIRSTDHGRFLQVSGTVIRTGSIRMLESKRVYRCGEAKCGFEFPVFANLENGVLEEPVVCPSQPPGRCKSTTFVLLPEKTRRADYQEIKIQEQVQSLAVGSIPRSIVVILTEDLVDACKAGDDISVTGRVSQRWSRTAQGARCDLELVILANHVRIVSDSGEAGLLTDKLMEDFDNFWAYFKSQDRPLAGRDAILRSINPNLHGLYLVKLAVALTLSGGVGFRDPDSGASTRGESHLLLIGDPGTGKSQFLRFAAKIVPRSVLTTGIGTTSAGLTCTAVRDGGEWMLEAGALVLADRGLCCIDEFGSIRPNERTTIHEAMEQQTISVAKAGLVCKLNARATVIAAANPKGKYDASQDIAVNTAIATPLLSRFDLVLVLLDAVNPLWDRHVSQFILDNACRQGDVGEEQERDDRVRTGQSGSSRAQEDRGTAAPSASQGSDVATSRGPEIGLVGEFQPSGSQGEDEQRKGRKEDPRLLNPPAYWSLPRLRAYFLHLRRRYRPYLTPQAQEIISQYYTRQRGADDRSAARTTLRLLESLVRLAQAHARLLCRERVTRQDAIMAVICMESSTHTSAMLGVETVLQSEFSADPDAEYIQQERHVLLALGLSHLLDQPEDDAQRGEGGGGGGGEAGVAGHPSLQRPPAQSMPTSGVRGAGRGGEEGGAVGIGWNTAPALAAGAGSSTSGGQRIGGSTRTAPAMVAIRARSEDPSQPVRPDSNSGLRREGESSRGQLSPPGLTFPASGEDERRSRGVGKAAPLRTVGEFPYSGPSLPRGELSPRRAPSSASAAAIPAASQGAPFLLPPRPPLPRPSPSSAALPPSLPAPQSAAPRGRVRFSLGVQTQPVRRIPLQSEVDMEDEDELPDLDNM